MDFHPFVSSSKDFTFDFSMSHCYARYRSEEISPAACFALFDIVTAGVLEYSNEAIIITLVVSLFLSKGIDA